GGRDSTEAAAGQASADRRGDAARRAPRDMKEPAARGGRRGGLSQVARRRPEGRGSHRPVRGTLTRRLAALNGPVGPSFECGGITEARLDLRRRLLTRPSRAADTLWPLWWSASSWPRPAAIA